MAPTVSPPTWTAARLTRCTTARTAGNVAAANAGKNAGKNAAMIERRAGNAVVHIAPEHGGRLAALAVDGHDLLVAGDGDSHPMLWGAFPMIPWAGRVRHGRFSFAGQTYQLPITMPPHAIHGTVHDRPWEVEPDGTLAIDLGPDWPFGGSARSRVDLEPHQLTWTLEAHADARSMPAQVGWHPWYRRPAQLDIAPNAMYELDDESIPTGRLIAPPPGPWDNCFTDLAGPPRITFPGGPTLTITSTCTDWVVYTQPEHALCVEPQSGPPDAFNRTPHVVEPGAPLVARMTLRWG
jgi:aldose 1-epimerase